MRTIILSGGLGYRLKEETEFKPKPMVNIGKKPILWHIMKIYAYYGYNDFIIALGYKGNYIKEYFLNQKYFNNNFTLHTKTGTTKIYKQNHEQIIDDFDITFVDTGEETLPGERILRIKDFIPQEDEDFMVTYGDGVANINIRELIKFHKKQNTIGTITSVHPTSRFGMFSINKNNIVKEFREKPVLKDWINGGFMIFKRKFFDYLRPSEFEHEGLKRLSKENQLSIYIHNGFWHSMDTYSDVKTLNELWEKDPKWKVWS